MKKEIKKKVTFKDLERTKSTIQTWFPYKGIVKVLTLFFVNVLKLTPNQVTWLGFLFSLASAWYFFNNQLILAAVLYQIRYIIDFTDGWVARLGKGYTRLGHYLDVFTGKLGLGLNAFGLLFGQYLLTGDITWALLCPIFIFLYIFRSWESAEVRFMASDYKDEQAKKLKARTAKKVGIKWIDSNVLIFFFIPVISVFTGYLKEVMIVITALLGLKMIYWFVANYKKLSKIDKSR